MDDLDPARDAAPETPDPPKPEITKAWGPLWAWACSQRLDWDGPAVKLAMREAANRDADYHEVAVILWRLAWDTAAGTATVLGELSYLNRTGSTAKGDGPAETLAALKAGDWARARQLTGTASVVPAVPAQGPPPAAETTEPEGN